MAGDGRYGAFPGALIVVVALVAAGAMLALGVPGPAAIQVAAAQAKPCPNANRPAADVSRKVLRRATICRINRLRGNRGRDSVRRQNQLQRVAQRHTRVMVRTECLKHRCPGERRLQRRIRRSGYLDGARRWRFTQSTGCAVNARMMVRKWVQRKFHRKNMLGPRLEHVGIGTVPRPAVARCGESTATFTALFAWRVP